MKQVEGKTLESMVPIAHLYTRHNILVMTMLWNILQKIAVAAGVVQSNETNERLDRNIHYATLALVVIDFCWTCSLFGICI